MPLFWRRTLPNPGRLEELKKEAQSVLSPDVFEGARFECNKTLSSKFALLHNVTLASGQPGAYEFGANFGDEGVLLASRIDLQGRLNGRLNAQLSDSLLVRMQAQAAPEQYSSNSFKADVDYKGGDFSAAAYVIGGGLLGGSYLQSVSQNLAIGGECFYHALNRRVRGGAGALRYVWGGKGEHVATAKVGSFGNVELAYQRKVRPGRPRPPSPLHACTLLPRACRGLHRTASGRPHAATSRAKDRRGCATGGRYRRHRCAGTECGAPPRPASQPRHPFPPPVTPAAAGCARR